ncbi:hypothetical protein BGZ58_009692 [Dissophora ornata]|nr:hypothetical protein BGZ58_009692 [Dissophora ornata]
MLDYKKFCNETLVSEISFRAFLTASGDDREKEQLIGSWTGTVLPYLERHSDAQKRRRAGYLKKATRKDLESIVDDVFGLRDHVKALLPNVSQQEQAVSSLHTSNVKNHICKSVGKKALWNMVYVSLFTQALKSQDPKMFGFGQEMKTRWDSDFSEVEIFWARNGLEEGGHGNIKRARQLDDDEYAVDQEPSRQRGKTQKLAPKPLQNDCTNLGAVSLTLQLLGSDLPSESSGPDFIVPKNPPKSNRSSMGSVDIRFAN